MIFGVFAPHWAFACCFAIITWVIKLGRFLAEGKGGTSGSLAQGGKVHLK